jgi:hypothetical protein
MITPAKLGWMAGIIDLKGRVYIKTNSQRAEGSRQIVLMVESRYPGIIREFSRLTGTNPESRLDKPLKDFMRRNCNEHCPEAHIHVNDDRIMPSVSRWTITGVAFAVVIDALMPVLTEEKGFPELRDEILAGMDLGGRGSSQVLTTLNRLMTLGWPMPEKVMQDLERRELALRVLTGEVKDGQGEVEA